MSGPEFDVSEKNSIGGLDTFVLSLALAIVCVFTTFFALISQPWRLAPLLSSQEPDGRRGMLLGPGVFFVLAITVFMLGAGWTATQETISSNDGLIGPAYAKSISAAVMEGDAWRAASLIGPVYVLSIIIGTAGRALRPLVGSEWTLRTSLRASFYQMAASICWIIASSAIIDAIGLSAGAAISRQLYFWNSAPILFLPFWQYFWFFRRTGEVSRVRAAGLAFVMLAIIAGAIFVIGQAGNLLSS